MIFDRGGVFFFVATVLVQAMAFWRFAYPCPRIESGAGSELVEGGETALRTTPYALRTANCCYKWQRYILGGAHHPHSGQRLLPTMSSGYGLGKRTQY